MKQHFSTEEVIKVLKYVQEMYKQEGDLTIFLVWDDADWLVIMQWMQDNGLFASNQKRPPLKAFVTWVRENNVPQLLTICDEYYMSQANRAINGARYPWENVEWYPSMMVRWRDLYQILNEKFSGLTL